MSPKGEVEFLMNEMLPFAKKMLKEHGEFYPFGGFLRSDGSIVHVGAADPSTDHPRSVDLLDTLKRDFRRRASREGIKATALLADTLVTPPNRDAKTDAIKVLLEHKDSYCAEVFFPYRRDGRGGLEVDAPFAQEGEPSVFVTD
jgi:hypothetical protein